MTELERIDKVINDLYSIRDVALSVFGDEGYFALDDSIRSLQKTWNICKRGQEEKLKNAYHTPVNNSKKSIKSSVRDDFARGLQNIMKEKHAEFADGTLEDNMVDIYDNYVSQYYEEELKEEGGEAVAEDWFRNTYYDDEEGIFIHNSRKPIKSGFWNLTQSDILQKIGNAKYELNDVAIALYEQKEKEFHSEINRIIDSIDSFTERYVRRPIQQSRKPIKSTFGGNAVFEIMDDKLMDARRNIRSCISINPKRELDNELQKIDELIGDALTHTEMVKNGDYDNYMSPVNNSRKPIKSSLEDRLIPYLEEFEEGYSNAMVDDPMDHYIGVDTTQVRLETFYDMFKNDYNLTDDDINKLENAVLDIWNETNNEINQNEWNEMYGKE